MIAALVTTAVSAAARQPAANPPLRRTPPAPQMTQAPAALFLRGFLTHLEKEKWTAGGRFPVGKRPSRKPGLVVGKTRTGKHAQRAVAIKAEGLGARAHWRFSMSRVLGNIFHSNFERDAIPRNRISPGKDGNHLCRGFDRLRDFFAPGGPLLGRYRIVVQSHLHHEAIILLSDTGG
jgi:hypothetical protein